MSEPLISIVITCFNYARYVGAAIASALAQTHRRIEIIVVNDGSTDDSQAVIEHGVDGHGDRVRLIHQPNGGSVSALNTGFAASSGDLVMFLDADDLMAPEAAAQVAAAWTRAAQRCNTTWPSSTARAAISAGGSATSRRATTPRRCAPRSSARAPTAGR